MSLGQCEAGVEGATGASTMVSVVAIPGDPVRAAALSGGRGLGRRLRLMEDTADATWAQRPARRACRQELNERVQGHRYVELLNWFTVSPACDTTAIGMVQRPPRVRTSIMQAAIRRSRRNRETTMSGTMIRPAKSLAALVAGVAMTVGLGACSLDVVDPGASESAGADASTGDPGSTPTDAADSGASESVESGGPAQEPSDASPSGLGFTPVTDLAKGDCIEEVPDLESFDGVVLVGCRTAHVAEVIGFYEVTDGDWPGRDALAADATAQCPGVRAEAIRADAPTTDRFLNFWPDEQEWQAGYRTVTCLFLAEEGALLTRSVLN